MLFCVVVLLVDVDVCCLHVLVVFVLFRVVAVVACCALLQLVSFEVVICVLVFFFVFGLRCRWLFVIVCYC